MTHRQALKQNAASIVRGWKGRRMPASQVLARLTEYANQPEYLDLTPHLVTEARLQGLFGRKDGSE